MQYTKTGITAGGERSMSYRWIGLSTGVVLGTVGLGVHMSATANLVPVVLTAVIVVQGYVGFWVGKKYESLQKMAYLDSLTGILVNRRFYDLLHQEIERARRHNYLVTLLFIDLDNFKKYNDQHGHLAGDRLLVNFAQLLEKTVRDQDSVGRWGGEEFVVLLPHTDTEQGLIVGKRIQGVLRQEIPGITISIGLATYPNHASCAAELAARADALMYEAKKKKDCMRAGPLSG